MSHQANEISSLGQELKAPVNPAVNEYIRKRLNDIKNKLGNETPTENTICSLIFKNIDTLEHTLQAKYQAGEIDYVYQEALPILDEAVDVLNNHSSSLQDIDSILIRFQDRTDKITLPKNSMICDIISAVWSVLKTIIFALILDTCCTVFFNDRNMNILLRMFFVLTGLPMLFPNNKNTAAQAGPELTIEKELSANLKILMRERKKLLPANKDKLEILIEGDGLNHQAELLKKAH